MFSVGTILTIVVLMYVYQSYMNLKKTKWVSQFPGPTPVLPIVGNGWEMAGHPLNFVDFIARNFQKFGLTWRFWVLDKATIVTADPNVIKIILSGQSHVEKHYMYDSSLLTALGKYSLILSKPEQWRKDRKVFNRAFHFALFEAGVQSAIDVSKISISTISSRNSKPMDVLPFFEHLVLYVVLKSLNVKESCLTTDFINTVQDQLDIVLEQARNSIGKPWTNNYLYWKLCGSEKKIQKLHKVTRDILKHLEDESNLFKNREDVQHNERDSFPRTMSEILADKSIPTEWKRDHFATLIGAATETTAVTATMTLFFLALNPDCMKRAVEEVDSVLGPDKNVENLEKANLKYLKMCIKESMRLHAPVPILGRTTSEDILLDDGKKIPKGANVAIVVSEVHCSPDNFEDPSRFDPERFTKENATKIKPFTYLPFSMGPRNCIGQKYSENMLPILLAPILGYFTVSTKQTREDIKYIYEIAGVPTPSVELIFKPRK